MASAPAATPIQLAISPAWRPITSTIKVRLWEEAVSVILSIASRATLTAVSKPMVYSVPAISLSMVPGIPIAGKPFWVNFKAPVKEPSPPTTTKASMPCAFICSIAFSWISGSLNSGNRAEYKKVPPRLKAWEQVATSKGLKSPSYKPLKP